MKKFDDKTWRRDIKKLADKHQCFMSAVVIVPQKHNKALKWRFSDFHNACVDPAHGVICYVEQLTKVIHSLQHRLQVEVVKLANAKRKEVS